jgi:hypothetical protein
MSTAARWPIGPLILATWGFVAWALFLFAGVAGIKSIADQHVPSFPSKIQTIYYEVVPLGFLVLIAGTLIWRLRTGPEPGASRALTLLILVLSLVLLFPYVFLWGGGV